MKNLDWVIENYEKILQKSKVQDVRIFYNSDVHHAIIRYHKKGHPEFIYLDMANKKRIRFKFTVTMNFDKYLAATIQEGVLIMFRVMREFHTEFQDEEE